MTRSPKKLNQQIKKSSNNKLPTTPWYKKVWVIVPLIASIASSVGVLLLNGPAVLQNVRVLPEEFRKTQEQFLSWAKEDDEWSGEWSTFPEGNIDLEEMNLSEGDIKVTIWAHQGDIGGMISTQQICEKIPFFHFLQFSGSVRGNNADVVIWDFVGGKRTEFAKIKIEREQNVITLKPISGDVTLLPGAVRLGKHPEPKVEDSDDFGQQSFCNNYR